MQSFSMKFDFSGTYKPLASGPALLVLDMLAEKLSVADASNGYAIVPAISDSLEIKLMLNSPCKESTLLKEKGAYTEKNLGASFYQKKFDENAPSFFKNTVF